ncbi:hypothetical protein HU200_053266 [Digitaria exilis]|uniref:Uncharacterized protein n=1 Tax=Digitaria exilis TaxID=1010633 RepID=A0A835APL0_9POAL|nr:hypothetical protein HU200_053266 [Digitaria exilis]
MMIWTCSSCLRGFTRSVWRKHYPLLSPSSRPPSLLPTHFFSSSSRRSTKRSATKAPTETDMEPFYVIRKGGVIAIYKTLSDCQAQVGNSVRVCDPSVTVYKGYSLRKETEEYLAARGLRNAIYSIDAADVRDELFDDLVPCPFQQPDGSAQSTLKRSEEMDTGPSKHKKVTELELFSDSDLSCILECDGACKGNLGKSGAGVIVRRLDGSVVWRPTLS